MTSIKTKDLTLIAILTALTITLGNIFRLPTPTGMVTLLDAGIFFTAFYLGKKEGALVGGLSGFLIDLIAGYPQWMIASLINHGLQGYFAGFKGKLRWFGLLLASVSMVGGYFIFSGFMNGWGAALADIPHNIMQNLVGAVLGYVLYVLVNRAGLRRA